VVPSQVAPVRSHFPPFAPGSAVVAITQVPPELVPVSSQIPAVRADIFSISAPVYSIVTKITARIASISAKRQSRAHHSKAQQSNQSSSHIAPLVFPRLVALW
jgi:hypothetical protein